MTEAGKRGLRRGTMFWLCSFLPGLGIGVASSCVLAAPTPRTWLFWGIIAFVGWAFAVGVEVVRIKAREPSKTRGAVK